MPSEDHWSRSLFDQKIIAFSALKRGMQHQIDRVQLADKSFWVCKRFAMDTWLGDTTLQRLLAIEDFTAYVARELSLSYGAYHYEGRSIFIVDGQYVVVRPYYKGQSFEESSIQQATLLGATLAKLHRLKKTPVFNLPAFPVISWPNLKTPSWLVDTIEQCNALSNTQDEDWLISHRDLHAANVLWRGSQTLHLIDWESAGLIHPAIELFGLASNIAGLASARCNPQMFLATLTGYKSINTTLPKLDNSLWGLTWHSWLLWYAFVDKKGWVTEAKQTMNVLIFKQRIQQELIKLYLA